MTDPLFDRVQASFDASTMMATLGARLSRVEGGLVEIRASWTPLENDLTVHLSLWIEILATLAGLPPVPAGVATVGGRRATRT